MALTPQQQALEQVTRAKRILVATKEHATNDALASAAACLLFLHAMGKQADALVPGISKDAIPGFLPGNKHLSPSLGAMRAFRISLDVKDIPLGELMYDVKDGKLEITIVPKHGEWTPQHLAFKHGEDRYDLVITVDAPDMQSLGDLARTQADFLYRTTIINIDSNATNEHWGQVNLVDLNATATTEVLFNLFEGWNRHLISDDIATALLAGMIAKTKSFRTPDVTPKTLSAASQLIAMGARREEIVHGLWRTRTVPTLKLWGRALSRLEQDKERGLIWTTLAQNDILETGARSETLPGVTDELIAYSPEAKAILFINETESAGEFLISIHAKSPYSAAELARPFGATGTREEAAFRFKDAKTLTEARDTVLERIRKTIDSRPR